MLQCSNALMYTILVRLFVHQTKNKQRVIIIYLSLAIRFESFFRVKKLSSLLSKCRWVVLSRWRLWVTQVIFIHHFNVERRHCLFHLVAMNWSSFRNNDFGLYSLNIKSERSIYMYMCFRTDCLLWTCPKSILRLVCRVGPLLNENNYRLLIKAKV